MVTSGGLRHPDVPGLRKTSPHSRFAALLFLIGARLLKTSLNGLATSLVEKNPH